MLYIFGSPRNRSRRRRSSDNDSAMADVLLELFEELKDKKSEKDSKKDEKKDDKKKDDAEAKWQAILAAFGIATWLGPILAVIYLKMLGMVTASLSVVH